MAAYILKAVVQFYLLSEILFPFKDKNSYVTLAFFWRRCHVFSWGMWGSWSWKGLNCNCSDDVIFLKISVFSSGQDNSVLVFLKLFFLGASEVLICSLKNVHMCVLRTDTCKKKLEDTDCTEGPERICG